MAKTNERLNQLLTDIATKRNQVKGMYDEADKRPDGACTKDEMTDIKRLQAEIREHEDQAAELKESLEIKHSNEEALRNLNTPVRPQFHGKSDGNGHDAPAFKSLSEQVLENEEMANFLKRLAPNGHISERTDIRSPQIDVKTLITGASATQGAPFVVPDFKPLVDMAFQRPLTVRDIITVGETGSDTVEYVRVTGVTNAAATVAEATNTSTGTKPESAVATLRVTETVKTIAHWIPITNRALADAPQLRTMIDNFLRYGLMEELEDQILSGDASGDNFDGVLHVANTTAQAFDTDILTTTRKGRTKVKTTGRANPTAYVMNPLDWQTFDLLQDNEARYYYGGPMKTGTPTLWGLPVVESEGMTQGTCVVADWKLAVLWDRMQTAISMSNSHANFFIQNLVAILAEMRAAFGILRPSAFVICDLTA